MDKHISGILEEFKKIPEVEVISLGGSRARNNFDSTSDYDIYVYYNKCIKKDARENILNKYVKYMEYSNKYWEEEDDGILLDDIKVEFIYRDIKFLQEIYEDVYINNVTQFGYTTCNIENIVTSKVLFDRNKVMSKFKKKFEIYPKQLSEKIVTKNLELLHDKMPSFGYQVIKALQRNDLISINNRLTEYLAVYMDIIFALNYKYNIGEKRLIDELKKCEKLPHNAVEDIENLLKNCMCDAEKSIELVNKISNNVYKLVDDCGLKYTKSLYSDL